MKHILFLLLNALLCIMPMHAMLLDINKLKSRVISVRNILIPEYANMHLIPNLQADLSSIDKAEALKNLRDFQDPNIAYSKWCLLFRKIAYLESLNTVRLPGEKYFSYRDDDLCKESAILYQYPYLDSDTDKSNLSASESATLLSQFINKSLNCDISDKVIDLTNHTNLDIVLKSRVALFSIFLSNYDKPRKEQRAKVLLKSLSNKATTKALIDIKNFALHILRVGLGAHINDLLYSEKDGFLRNKSKLFLLADKLTDIFSPVPGYSEYQLREALNLCCKLGLDLFKLQHPQRTTVLSIRGLLDRESAFIRGNNKKRR